MKKLSLAATIWEEEGVYVALVSGNGSRKLW
jgi:hypothetical protein